MSLRRLTLNDELNHSYYQLPRFLLSDAFASLSNDARVIYALLRDRASLSAKNQQCNLDGEIYVYCSRANLMKTLRLSDKTVSKAMAALRNAGLIQEVRQGQGKANQIFLMLVDSAIEEKTTNSKENILDFQNRNISDSRHGDITVLDTENFRANQTKENKNNINYMLYPSISHILAGVKPLTNSSDIEAVQHFVKHILDAAYDCISLFEKNHPAEQFHPEVTPLVEAVGDALCDTICLHCPSIITIGSDTYSRLTVRLTLIKTEPYHILQILRIINKGRLLKDIKHLKKYLLTSLFMAIRSDRPML